MINNKKRSIPLSQYQEAFMLLFKCKLEEFDTSRLGTDELIIIKYQDQVFQLLHAQDLDQYATLLLTREELATAIPLNSWIHIAENVHLEPDFYRNLNPELNEKEKNKLNMAISTSSNAGNKIKAFWHSIYDFDKGALYSKAIVAASQFYDFNSLKEELLELLITEGDSLLNQIHNGTFEIIHMDESSEGEENIFYIFNMDPLIWKSIS